MRDPASSDDVRLRVLWREFLALAERRLDLDLGGDDVSRANAHEKWMQCVLTIMALRASSRLALGIKARVLLALIDATGASGPAIDAARSLAADLNNGDGEAAD